MKIKYTKWEKEWLLSGFIREYEIHDIDNFANKEESEIYINKVKELEKKIKKLEVLDK